MPEKLSLFLFGVFLGSAVMLMIFFTAVNRQYDDIIKAEVLVRDGVAYTVTKMPVPPVSRE